MQRLLLILITMRDNGFTWEEACAILSEIKPT